MAGFSVGKKKVENLRVRKLDGKVVKTVLYNGRALGHGQYFAGSVDDKLVLDEAGKPLPYRQVGQLEAA